MALKIRLKKPQCYVIIESSFGAMKYQGFQKFLENIVARKEANKYFDRTNRHETV
jgi:hypothetical protein